MDILGFILGLLAIVAVMSVAVVGIGVFGITRIVQIITNRLPGRSKQPKQISANVPQHRNPQSLQQTRPAQPPVRQQATAPRPQPRSFVYLDADASAEKIAQVMHPYESQRVVGFYAHETIRALEMAELRRKSLFSELDRNFADSSISWDHFASTANEALDAIPRNCALLANRVQAFDVDDFERMAQYYTTGGEMRNGAQDPATIKRWDLLRDTKQEMDDLRSANEGLLLELNELSAALSKLSSGDSADDSARIAQEVSRLVEETKYYR